MVCGGILGDVSIMWSVRGGKVEGSLECVWVMWICLGIG